MSFVVDASVTMAWCFDDEATDFTDDVLDRLRTDEAVVPALWQLEVADVMLSSERRGRLSEAQATRFVELLGQLPIRVELEPIDSSALLGIGRRHGLSAYDACYLLLAERLGVPLATVDEALAKAGRQAGVSVWPET
jgi:predicted nucleic acid-binding protein